MSIESLYLQIFIDLRKKRTKMGKCIIWEIGESVERFFKISKIFIASTITSLES